MMKIAIVSPSKLPPLRYGGTERAVMWLRKGLIELSHQTLLICPEINPNASYPSIEWSPWPQETQSWIKLSKEQKITLFHFMCLPPPSFPLNELPHLITIQGNGQENELFPQNSVFVSRNHAHRHNAEAFVHNGIDVSEFPFNKTQITNQRRALFLAKASWKVKNLNGALRIARKSKFSLDVAGGNRPLNHWGLLAFHAKFHGMIDDQAKKLLLNECDVLLFPVLWHEPFGIAVLEALAAGLPAIVSPFGSLPEIVTSECGFVSASEENMQDFLIHSLTKISPKACRARVEENFTHLHMTKSYIEFYEKILSHENINKQRPRTIPDSSVFHLDQKMP